MVVLHFSCTVKAECNDAGHAGMMPRGRRLVSRNHWALRSDEDAGESQCRMVYELSDCFPTSSMLRVDWPLCCLIRDNIRAPMCSTVVDLVRDDPGEGPSCGDADGYVHILDVRRLWVHRAEVVGIVRSISSAWPSSISAISSRYQKARMGRTSRTNVAGIPIDCPSQNRPQGMRISHFPRGAGPKYCLLYCAIIRRLFLLARFGAFCTG